MEVLVEFEDIKPALKTPVFTRSQSFCSQSLLEKYCCKNCDFKTHIWKLLLRHVEQFHQANRIPNVESALANFKCKDCDFETYSRLHLLKHSIDGSDKYKDGDFQEKNEPIQISSVKKENSFSEDIEIVMFDGAKWFHCKHCSFKSKRKAPLNEHLNCIHTPVENIVWYKCGQCDYRGKSRQYLRKHKRTKHAVLDLKQGDENEKKVTFERTIFSGVKESYDCDLCLYKSRTPWGLQKHLVTKHEIKTKQSYCQEDTNFKRMVIKEVLWFKCKHCSYISKHKKSIKLHLKRKHKLQEEEDELKFYYQCNHCSYKFAQRKLYEEHLQETHSQIPLFDCTACGAKFWTKTEWKTHINEKHVFFGPPKQYMCVFCSYKGKRLSHLARHFIHIHKPLNAIDWQKCNDCGIKCKTRQALKKHIVNHHTSPEDIKWLECDQCDFKTKLPNYLMKHVKRKHASGIELEEENIKVDLESYIEIKEELIG